MLTTTEELRREAHVIERVHGLIVVGLDLSCKRGKQEKSSAKLLVMVVPVPSSYQAPTCSPGCGGERRGKKIAVGASQFAAGSPLVTSDPNEKLPHDGFFFPLLVDAPICSDDEEPSTDC